MNVPALVLFRISLVVAGLALSSGPARAASFDCAKATTEVEEKICADTELSILDDRLAAVYRKALVVATDKDALRREQREWLARRDACLSQNCLKSEHESRLAELDRRLRDGKEGRPALISGKYTCEMRREEKNDHKASERLNLTLEIYNNLVKKFSSSWVFASDNPDLRPGYASTCHMELKDLEQVRQTDGILLRLRPGHHQKYQENCEIRIQSTQSSLHVGSAGCIYECLALDLVIDQSTGNCRRVK